MWSSTTATISRLSGISSQSAFVVKDDPSQWTKKDRAEVVKRAARGEKIKL